MGKSDREWKMAIKDILMSWSLPVDCRGLILQDTSSRQCRICFRIVPPKVKEAGVLVLTDWGTLTRCHSSGASYLLGEVPSTLPWCKDTLRLRDTGKHHSILEIIRASKNCHRQLRPRECGLGTNCTSQQPLPGVGTGGCKNLVGRWRKAPTSQFRLQVSGIIWTAF